MEKSKTEDGTIFIGTKDGKKWKKVEKNGKLVQNSPVLLL